MKNIESFTLIELVVVAIIIGILVLSGTPSFLKTTQRGYAVDAMRNLMAMYAAQNNYSLNNNGTWAVCTGLANCNTLLETNIISNPPGVVYNCTNLYCEAIYTGVFNMRTIFNAPLRVGSVVMKCKPSNITNPCCRPPIADSDPDQVCL